MPINSTKQMFNKTIHIGENIGKWHVITLPPDSFFMEYFYKSLEYFKNKKNVLNLYRYKGFNSKEVKKSYYVRKYDLIEKSLKNIDCLIIDSLPTNDEHRNKYYNLIENNLNNLYVIHIIAPSNYDITTHSKMIIFDFANRLNDDKSVLLKNWDQ